MNTKLPRTVLLVVALVATPSAFADDQRKQTSDKQTAPPPASTESADPSTGSTDPSTEPTDPKVAAAAKPKLGTAEVMKITQTAMTHIAAADKALDKGNTKAAKSALAKSEKALSRLYDTPPMQALLNEFDEALTALAGTSPAVKPLDLSPLSASVTSYQAYVDPSVRTGVDDARDHADKGDRKGAEKALRLARNRVAIDVAFLPVEEAYVRVLAAQQALQKGKRKQAARLLEHVPVVISELQISQPLVPIRFKLHAAAEAADAQQWDRVQKLLSEVDRDMQELERLADDADLSKELTPIADEVERLHQQAIAGTNPRPDQIRELAKRARDLGIDDDRG